MGGSWIYVHGRLTKDPETRSYNKSDGSTGTMTVFCVAVDARFGDKTYYYDCTAHGRNGELIMAHFKKGQEIIVSGEHVYNEKDKKKFWNVNVDRFEFCGTKANNEGQGETFTQLDKDVPF